MKYLAFAVACIALTVLAFWRVMAARDERIAAEIATLKQMTEKLSPKVFSGGDVVAKHVPMDLSRNSVAMPRSQGPQGPPPEQQAQPAASSASPSAVYADIQAFYQASLEAQSIDVNWSREATRDLRAVFDDAGTTATTLKSLECRQTICRAELTHDSDGDALTFMKKWMYGHAGPRWKGPMSGGVEPSKGDGAIRSVFFLAREGTELPAYN
jgi:hypothetical protein